MEDQKACFVFASFQESLTQHTLFPRVTYFGTVHLAPFPVTWSVCVHSVLRTQGFSEDSAAFTRQLRGCPVQVGELTLPKGVLTFIHIKDLLKCQQTLKEGY